MEVHVALTEFSLSIVWVFIVYLEHGVTLGRVGHLKQQHLASDLVYNFVCRRYCPDKVRFLSLRSAAVREVVLEGIKERKYELVAVS